MTWLRRIARILSGLQIAFFVLSFLGDRSSWATLPMADKISLSAMGVILLGMLVAWKWELTGGLIVVGGFVLLANVKPSILALWAMWMIPFIGALFLISVMGFFGGILSTGMFFLSQAMFGPAGDYQAAFLLSMFFGLLAAATIIFAKPPGIPRKLSAR